MIRIRIAFISLIIVYLSSCNDQSNSIGKPSLPSLPSEGFEDAIEEESGSVCGSSAFSALECSVASFHLIQRIIDANPSAELLLESGGSSEFSCPKGGTITRKVESDNEVTGVIVTMDLTANECVLYNKTKYNGSWISENKSLPWPDDRTGAFEGSTRSVSSVESTEVYTIIDEHGDTLVFSNSVVAVTYSEIPMSGQITMYSENYTSKAGSINLSKYDYSVVFNHTTPIKIEQTVFADLTLITETIEAELQITDKNDNLLIIEYRIGSGRTMSWNYGGAIELPFEH